MTKINYFHESMPKNQRFIALYSDGGGASLFSAEGHITCHDAENEITLAIEELPEMGYNAWIALPDDYKFWYEQRG